MYRAAHPPLGRLCLSLLHPSRQMLRNSQRTVLPCGIGAGKGQGIGRPICSWRVR